MIILLHICIALASIALATYGYFRPSTKKVLVSYGFMLATIVSGTYLILASNTNILKSCIVGLVYLTAVSVITVATHIRIRRFAEVTSK